MLKTVAESTTVMNSTAAALLASSARTSQSAEAALQSSNEATVGSTVAAGAANELTSSIAEINRQLTQTAGSVRAAVAKADKTDLEIATLADAAQKIGDVVKLIQHIAGQTNLSALNATIEAARAGGAGRGFAVVAAEVKSLSVRTAKRHDDITRQIGAVQGSAANVIDALRVITKQMQEIEVYASEAATSVERQSVATQEISDSVAGAAEGAKASLSVLNQVTSDAYRTSESAKTVLRAADQLEGAAAQLREEVNSFLAGVSEQAHDISSPPFAARRVSLVSPSNSLPQNLPYSRLRRVAAFRTAVWEPQRGLPLNDPSRLLSIFEKKKCLTYPRLRIQTTCAFSRTCRGEE